MPLSAVAFCPCPPVLVPAVAQGAASEMDAVRDACDRAVSALLASTGGAGPVTVLSAGPAPRLLAAGSAGSLAGLGVPVRVGGDGPDVLSLGSTLGAWLLARAGAGPGAYVEVGADGRPGPDAVAALAASNGLLVMGDGTACLGPRAPGGSRPEAAAYDDRVVAALGSGDPALLAGLDPVEGAALLAAGVPAWRAAASALASPGGSDGGNGAGNGTWAATLLHREAPYGVSYLVATWLPRSQL